MKKKALIVWGGWMGHDPDQVANAYKDILEDENFEVEVSNTLDSFKDEEKLMNLSLIIPCWSHGVITKEQHEPVIKAVASGVGLVGCHGGMCDSFHDCMDWLLMTGGQWVSHPSGQHVKYKVHYVDHESYITEDQDDFWTTSEQYYLLVDPSVHVLATTRMPIGKGPFVPSDKVEVDSESTYGTWNFNEKVFDDTQIAKGPHIGNGIFDMPVMWAKYFGRGRVFYNSLGHSIGNFMEKPNLEVTRKALLWAAK